MAARATRGRNANTLQYAFTRIVRELDQPRRADLHAGSRPTGAARTR
jgi:hypothetical protein